MMSSTYEIIILDITSKNNLISNNLLYLVITMALQLYILFLIYFKSPDPMKNYRFFLYYLTFWDLILTTSFGVCFQPIPIAPISAVIIKGVSAYFGHKFSIITVSFLMYSIQISGYFRLL
jgi:hypothetical protein